MYKPVKKGHIHTEIDFKTIPKKIDDLIMEVEKMRKGGSTSLIIESHIRFAVSIASKYVHKFKRKNDDIISVALEALCQAVQWIKEGRCEHQNYTGYIGTCIHSAIDEFLDADSVIKVSQVALRKNRELIKEHPIPEPPKAVMFIEQDEGEPDIGITNDDTSLIDLEDTLKRLKPEYRELIKMRYAGYTDEEIAAILGTTERVIFLRRQRICESLKLGCWPMSL